MKRNDIADIAWGLGFVLFAWSSYFMGQRLHAIESLLVLSFVTIWGLRLAWHILQRNKGKKEDYRYAAWRKEWGKWLYIRSFLQVYMLQGFLLFVISFPVYIVMISASNSFGPITVVGVVLWLYGFFFEAVGDAQLAKHIRDPEKKGST